MSGLQICNTQVEKVCAKGSTSVEGQTLELGDRSSGFTSNGVKIQEGLHVTFNRDGTTVGESAAQYEERTGTNVQATQGDLLTTSAAEISTNITPRQADGLPPCSMCDGDGSTSWSNPLAEAAKDAPPLQRVEDIKNAAALIQFIPAANVGATAVIMIINLGQGNGTEALSQAPNLIPGFSWLRKADKAKDVVQYTRSNLRLGQQMHKSYKAGLEDKITTFKEFRGVPGIRPDFVDFGTKTIYELKPFNPRGLKSGAKQLEKYRKAFEKKYGGTWKTVLDTY